MGINLLLSRSFHPDYFGKSDPENRGNELRNRWGLTAREFDILAAVADNQKRTVLAARLHVTPQTLKTHFRRLADKFELGGMEDLRSSARNCLAP
jgi:DNA-binding CsgD family transcriptional regulator